MIPNRIERNITSTKANSIATVPRRSRNKRANVPRYVGIGLLIGSAIAITASGNKGAVAWLGWGALAGGGASYAAGYFAFGGRTCNEAAKGSGCGAVA